LLSALTWLITKYPDEASAAGLDIAITELTNWLNREVPIQFWCADVNSEIQFPLTNRQLISFESNTTKHHLLRLSELIKKLETLCVKAGYNFSSQQLIAILHCMLPEARSRLEYHFTFMLELIGHLFLAINQFIVGRFQRNPTNIAENMVFPTGITSDVFRDLYANILVFKRYDEERIINYTPTTSQMLRLRYQ